MLEEVNQSQLSEIAESVRPLADRILRPHVSGTDKSHLRALHDDLNRQRNRERAKGFILKMFMRILAYQPDSSSEAVMRVVREIYASEPFRDMLCDVTKGIILDTCPEIKRASRGFKR